MIVLSPIQSPDASTLSKSAFVSINGKSSIIHISAMASERLGLADGGSVTLSWIDPKWILKLSHQDPNGLPVKQRKGTKGFQIKSISQCRQILKTAGLGQTATLHLVHEDFSAAPTVTYQSPRIVGLQLQIRDRIKKIIKEKVLTNAEFLTMIRTESYNGPSEGSLSDLLNDNKAFSEAWLSTLWAAINSRFSNNPEIVKSTRQYRMIENLLSSCHVNRDFMLITGNTGIGKSLSLRNLVEETADTYYFKMDRQSSWFTFLLRFAASIGMSTKEIKNINQYKLHDNIEAHLLKKSKDHVVIVLDEFERLALQHWIRIKDMKTSWPNVGFLVSAIPDRKVQLARYARLNPETWRPVDDDHVSNSYTTLARRFKVFDIPSVSPEDTRHFFQAKGVLDSQVLQYAEQVIWNYDQADMMLKKAEKMGLELPTMTLGEFQQVKVQ